MSLDDKSTLDQIVAWCRQANIDSDVWRHMALLGLNELYKYGIWGWQATFLNAF